MSNCFRLNSSHKTKPFLHHPFQFPLQLYYFLFLLLHHPSDQQRDQCQVADQGAEEGQADQQADGYAGWMDGEEHDQKAEKEDDGGEHDGFSGFQEGNVKRLFDAQPLIAGQLELT